MLFVDCSTDDETSYRAIGHNPGYERPEMYTMYWLIYTWK